ncbi:interleukin-17D isoform X2 [Lemur catta]|uniref:interleukin-17D isoform X2 n=1 Tax=Lemur catta TaxID=9447 RepID=UPI001E26746F|nr:interleukin-17D isoform X2 [Lemur catta]
MLGTLDLLRPRQVPQVPARGLLPVPRLPDRAVRRGGLPLPQRAGVRARRRAAPHGRLRRGPRGLRRGLRHRPGGLHLRPRAREGRGEHQLQHRQTGRQAAARPQRRARPALSPLVPGLPKGRRRHQTRGLAFHPAVIRVSRRGHVPGLLFRLTWVESLTADGR